MGIAYCIAAYKRPSQCARLVRRLLADDPECRVVLHYDQRQSSFDFGQVASPRVQVVRERPLYWGSTQLLELYVEMFLLAIEDGCNYVVMLSGQDYPLRHLDGLEAELSAYDVWADAEPLFALDGTCNWAEGRRRYSYRWWHADDPPRVLRGVERVVATLLRVPVCPSEPPLPRFVHFRQRNQVWWGARSRGPGVPVHCGETWMNLSVRALEAVSSCPHHLTSFFHRVPCPDEACFHTILHNATGLTFAPGYARYVRWTEGEPHPEVLTVNDLESMVASGAHFGRKFDEVVDSSVLDRLDVLSRSSSSNDTEIIGRDPSIPCPRSPQTTGP